MAEFYPCYALQVKSRYELTTAAILRLKGYDPFVPTYLVRRRWSDRYVNLDVPLLPGYVLCRFDTEQRMPVLCTEGVQAIVGAGKAPLPVDEQELAHLRTIVQSGLPAAPCPFQAGQTVQLERGPLAGVKGMIVTVQSHERLVVSIVMLRRSVCVKVERDWVAAVPPERRPVLVA
jgi:transcription antitermination factor NusG